MKSDVNNQLKQAFDRVFNNARKMYEAEMKQNPLAGILVITNKTGTPIHAIPVWNN